MGYLGVSVCSSEEFLNEYCRVTIVFRHNIISRVFFRHSRLSLDYLHLKRSHLGSVNRLVNRQPHFRLTGSMTQIYEETDKH